MVGVGNMLTEIVVGVNWRSAVGRARVAGGVGVGRGPQAASRLRVTMFKNKIRLKSVREDQRVIIVTVCNKWRTLNFCYL